MTINERLFILMDKKNITQEQLADKLDTKQSTISAWKTRGTNPPSKYLPRICDILEVSMEYLTTGKDNKNDNFELPKHYYDFAKDLREMGATDEDLERLLTIFKTIKPK